MSYSLLRWSSRVFPLIAIGSLACSGQGTPPADVELSSRALTSVYSQQFESGVGSWRDGANMPPALVDDPTSSAGRTVMAVTRAATGGDYRSPWFVVRGGQTYCAKVAVKWLGTGATPFIGVQPSSATVPTWLIGEAGYQDAAGPVQPVSWVQPGWQQLAATMTMPRAATSARFVVELYSEGTIRQGPNSATFDGFDMAVGACPPPSPTPYNEHFDGGAGGWQDGIGLAPALRVDDSAHGTVMDVARVTSGGDYFSPWIAASGGQSYCAKVAVKWPGTGPTPFIGIQPSTSGLPYWLIGPLGYADSSRGAVQPVSLTATGWQEFQVTVPMPPGASKARFTVELYGTGDVATASFDDFSLSAGACFPYSERFQAGAGSWQDATGNAPTLADTTDSPAGLKAMTISRATSGGDFFSPWISLPGGPLPAPRSYCAKAFVKWAGTGATPFIGIQNSGQTLSGWIIGATDYVDPLLGPVQAVSPATSAWQPFQVTVTMPAGSTQARFVAELFSGSVLPGANGASFDGFSLRSGHCYEPRGRKVNPIQVTARATAAGSSPSFATDGTSATKWSAAGLFPTWIQLDLGRTVAIKKVRLLSAKALNGAATFSFSGGQDPAAPPTSLGSVKPKARDGQWIEYECKQGCGSVRYLRISSSNSTMAWREIEVYQGLEFFSYFGDGWEGAEAIDNRPYTARAGVNLVWVSASYWADLTTRIQEARQRGANVILVLGGWVFGPTGHLYPDWRARWSNLLAQIIGSNPAGTIAAIYPHDEPYWSSMAPNDLEALCDQIHADTDLPIGAIESPQGLETANYNPEVIHHRMFDWVGFDCYGPWNGCANQQMDYWINSIKLQPGQRRMAAPPTQRSNIENDPDPPLPEPALLDVIDDWHQEVVRDSSYVAMAAFRWGLLAVGDDPFLAYSSASVKQRYFQLARTLLGPERDAVFPMAPAAQWNDVSSVSAANSAVDGDRFTYFGSNLFTSSANPTGFALYAWLAQPHYLDTLVLNPRIDAGQVQAFPRQYRIFLFNTNTNLWDAVGDYKTQPTIDSSSVMDSSVYLYSGAQSRPIPAVAVWPLELGTSSSGQYYFQMAEIGVADTSGSCACNSADYTLHAACGRSVCGADYWTYTCTSSGWTQTSQSCDGACKCVGTGPGKVPVTVACGYSSCGEDYKLHTCSSTGWTGTGQACSPP